MTNISAPPNSLPGLGPSDIGSASTNGSRPAGGFDTVLQVAAAPFQRSSMPSILSMERLSMQDRQVSTALVGAAQTLLQQISSGIPAEKLFPASSRLFEAVQSGKFSPMDAKHLANNLEQAKSVLMTSSAYEQGAIIPDVQSAVEGHVTIALDRLETAMRLGMH